MTSPRRPLRLLAPAVAVIAVLATAGCGDDTGGGASGDGSPSADGSSATEGPVADPTGSAPLRLELRVVSASSDVGAPDSQVQADFEALQCSRPPSGVPTDEPLTTCDDEGVKYALEPAAVDTRVATALVVPGAHSAWVVDVTLDDAATDDLAALSRRLTRTRQAAAVVVDDVVSTTTVFTAAATDGRITISGTFTEDEADHLADALLGS